LPFAFRQRACGFLPNFYQQSQIQHNDFVTLKEKMAMQPNVYVAQNGKKRIHESYVNYSTREVNNYIEYNEDISLPDELIKFYRIDSKYNCDAFLNNYLWAANPRSFNDPFDCPIQLWDYESFNSTKLKEILNPEIHHILSENLKDNQALLIDIQIAGTGIISLHEFVNSSQDVLWGYYTNQEGFSIKFDTHPLIKEWGVPFKTEYIDEKELKAFSLSEVEDTEDLFPMFLRWMTQKKDFWRIENEWRFIFPLLQIETMKMDAFPSERMKKYPITAIKEVSLGLKFFDTNNSFQESINDMYFVADTVTHQAHNQILTFLSDHQEILVSHMFFKDDLKLHPRKCQIFKQSNNRFLIQY
jgi:hypothetical protein